MSVTDELLQNNARYADSFDKGDLPLPPARGLAVVACMDARLDTHKLLGLDEGDAHVIRNAGGVVSDDAIRSLVISQRLLGTREVVIIQHTDCGMLTFRDDDVKDAIEADTGLRPSFAMEAFGDLEENVRQSIRRGQGQSLHSGKGQRARLRVRLRDGPAERGHGRLGAAVGGRASRGLHVGRVPARAGTRSLLVSVPVRWSASRQAFAPQQDTMQSGSAERPRIRSLRAVHIPGGISGPGRWRTGTGSIVSPSRRPTTNENTSRSSSPIRRSEIAISPLPSSRPPKNPWRTR